MDNQIIKEMARITVSPLPTSPVSITVQIITTKDSDNNIKPCKSYSTLPSTLSPAGIQSPPVKSVVGLKMPFFIVTRGPPLSASASPVMDPDYQTAPRQSSISNKLRPSFYVASMSINFDASRRRSNTKRGGHSPDSLPRDTPLCTRRELAVTHPSTTP